jgi:hypothetical protein
VSELHAQFNRALFDDTIAENARLKAEVERLTAFTTRTIIPNEELQAQVKALRIELADAQESNHILNETIAMMRKEGKQS